jgi:hypothetical protein
VNNAVVAIALSTLALTGCADSGGGTTTGSSAPSPSRLADAQVVAQKLADNQTESDLGPNDPLVRQISKHVASLDKKCRGTVAEVGGSIDFASTDLAKHGINESRASIAARLDRNIKGFDPNFDCQGFVAAYLILREKGGG